MAANPRLALTPTDPAQRIQIVDILHGFALLGILFVNMELFGHPAQLVVAPVEIYTSMSMAQ